MDLSFRLAEHFIIVTQSNYSKSQVIEFTKLLDHANLISDNIVEKPYDNNGDEYEETKMIISLEQRFEL
jgi:hypothetical protein